MLDILINISKVSPLVAAIFNSIIGILVFAHNKSRTQNIVFFVFSICLAVWAFSCFIQSITTKQSTALLWDYTMYSVAAYVPVLTVLLSSTFSKTPIKKTLIIGLVCSTGFLLSNYIGYFRQGVHFISGQRFITQASFGWYGYMLFFSIYFIIACKLIFDTYYIQNNFQKRNFQYLLVSLFILLIAGLSYFILILLSFNKVVDSFLNLNSSFLLCVYSLIMSYLILKRELMDIHQVITRSLASIITSALVVSSFLILKYVSSPTIFYIPAIILTLVWTWYGRPLYRLIQSPIESKLNSDWYNSDMFLEKAASTLKDCHSNRNICQSIETLLKETIGIQETAIFYKPIDSANYKCLNSENICLANNDVLVRQLIQNPDLAKTQRLQELNDGQQTSVYGLYKQAKIIIPCCSLQGLEILIILGPRISGARYRSVDIATFNQLIRLLWFHFSLRAPLQAVKDELNKNAAHLKQVHDLAAFGTLSKSIAHEIKNPLNMMQANFRYVLQHCKPIIKDPEVLEFSEAALSSIKRLDDTIRLMLRFGLDKHVDLSPIDVHEALANVIKLATYSCRQKNIKLSMNLDYDGLILGNLTTLEQIATNLLVNSMEAIEESKQPGTITFGTQTCEFKSAGILKHGLKLWIHDTGKGIPETEQARIFNAFESSKYSNIGLGLAIVMQQVHALDGEIQLISQPGNTQFNLFFPRYISKETQKLS